ncbi:sigma-70 family RNA polymerase sigma factor [Mucilaginibacter jinjuensis]|uniref:Sigma-70 family RNA polymerase sigma factor n=1 Tax=Mucilaginibacter jinjuensis TaxID=1176721 RepID=A0ABY7T2V5_9SPHI|nr:sigma-70 family RNA polymerase sigma factor [Mucilaginibacter jinjuensis]WCT10588.1 sigma-70 family RNA polymerase sigma factor [Mucilaginibacter jinjuensis]
MPASNQAVSNLSDAQPNIDPHKWVAAHADYLYSYALTRINDEEQARDLVQETFLAALEKVKQFEGRSSERTWLTAILKNKVIDVYRKKSSAFAKRTDITEAEHDQEDFFDPTDGHWNPTHWPMPFGIETYDPLMTKEFNNILQKCMQKLPALWLSVFTMKHIDEESTSTICSELKVSDSNFWVIIHRTKLNLRSCLQKNWI